jgi:hypothetical protein
MTFEEWKQLCPTLAQVFGQETELISHVVPIGNVIGSRTERYETSATRIETCTRTVKMADPNWLESKLAKLRSEKDPCNVSGIIGEIRAYGELLWVWRDTDLSAPAQGPDFLVHLDDSSLSVEVHTPQGRSSIERTTLEHESTTFGNVTTRLSEVAPFGLPERPAIDTAQGECVSQIAGIKGTEHQFDEETLSVLWLDFNDPSVSLIGLDSEQALPVMRGENALTSGCLWNAFYAEKGDPIFDSLSLEGSGSRIYEMEFHGRFSRGSKIDFVICDIATDKIILQNPFTSKPIPDSFFRDVFRLFGFNLALSWLDWPVRGYLKPRVEHAREEIRLFTTAFRLTT